MSHGEIRPAAARTRRGLSLRQAEASVLARRTRLNRLRGRPQAQKVAQIQRARAASLAAMTPAQRSRAQARRRSQFGRSAGRTRSSIIRRRKELQIKGGRTTGAFSGATRRGRGLFSRGRSARGGGVSAGAIRDARSLAAFNTAKAARPTARQIRAGRGTGVTFKVNTPTRR